MLDQQNKNVENNVKLFFYKKINELIFRSNDFIINNYVYKFHRFYVSFFVVKKIIVVVHNDNYFDFARCYKKIATFYYVHDLFKLFRNYLKHCFKYLTY